MLHIRLSYWHLMAFFMWLSFKLQFPTAPTGHVILALKELGKVKIHLRQVTKARRQGRYIALLFLQLQHQLGWVVNSTRRPLYHWARPDPVCVGGFVGPRSGLRGCGKSCPHWDAIPRLSIIQQVGIPTLLFQSINNNQKYKVHFKTILTAVHCTYNSLLHALYSMQYLENK